MIFADKVIRLRKRNGWSQEELAEKMNVSRQAVSKWEAAQTVPDLQKLLQLAALFGVTTDYLLKDELEEEEYTEESAEERPREESVRRVTLDEANAYLGNRKKAAGTIALGVMLCMVSPIPLFLLGGAAVYGGFPEVLMGVLGLVFLLGLVTAAVALFVRCGFSNAPYAFLDSEPFETAYGVHGMVLERQKAFRDRYAAYNTAGVCICILAAVPLFVGGLFRHEFLMVVLFCVTLLIAAAGVRLFILAGVPWGAMQRLLREGDFSEQSLRKNKTVEQISMLYWCLATAVYLGISFITEDWSRSWIVWPVAGVLYAGVLAVCELLINRNR